MERSSAWRTARLRRRSIECRWSKYSRARCVVPPSTQVMSVLRRIERKLKRPSDGAVFKLCQFRLTLG